MEDWSCKPTLGSKKNDEEYTTCSPYFHRSIFSSQTKNDCNQAWTNRVRVPVICWETIFSLRTKKKNNKTSKDEFLFSQKPINFVDGKSVQDVKIRSTIFLIKIINRIHTETDVICTWKDPQGGFGHLDSGKICMIQSTHI